MNMISSNQNCNKYATWSFTKIVTVFRFKYIHKMKRMINPLPRKFNFVNLLCYVSCKTLVTRITPLCNRCHKHTVDALYT